MTAISAGPFATAAHLALAEEMFAPLGRTIRVPESQQDAVTALSGSGPAYFYFLVEAMTDAGILLGLPRQVAHDLIVQTAIGSATMLRESGEHPVKLREAVTSPAGTTISAIRDLEYLVSQGAEVKGYAPLLLDFPGQIDRVPVYWCWLEGDPDIGWYHRLDAGFAGRRRVPALD